MNVTININEAMLARLVEELIAKSLFGGAATPQSSAVEQQSQKLEALQQENAELKSQLSNLQNEIATVKAQQVSKVAPAPASAPEPKAQQAETTEPELEKANKWVRDHLSEWIDQPCSFLKSQGRTWRELAENKGEKVSMKGKQMPPRAYLHALENWKECNVWARLKAKITLEVVPSKNGVHPVGANT